MASLDFKRYIISAKLSINWAVKKGLGIFSATASNNYPKNSVQKNLRNIKNQESTNSHITRGRGDKQTASITEKIQRNNSGREGSEREVEVRKERD